MPFGRSLDLYDDELEVRYRGAHRIADLVRSFQAMEAEELRKAIESRKKDD